MWTTIHKTSNLECQSFTSTKSLYVTNINSEVFLEDDQFFEIVGKAPAAPRPAPVQAQKTADASGEDDMVVEVASRKRKMDRDEIQEKKKQKAKEENGIIEL
jgi:hypothetical protein